ncbi:MAG TPA: DVUA0089 family protein [Vitreimonas sp.]|uniref:DVUA0089 family protein n=1 Tax=Vitreimonas sp. TaxID=3069702 RepID=UPI002D263E82|nr:DVUA0089 family protein [Vitreimonas sp.]HYD86668.1 DVUA0089 family protein [Vitreimonas sp.]
MRACLTLIALVLMTASAAGQTSADRSLSGHITARAPNASFQLQLEAGQIVNLTTSSAEDLDTVLRLTDPGGRTVAENDDWQEGDLSSRIVYVARTRGRHTAVVSGYGDATGAFQLQVSYGLDVGLSDAARTLREERLSFNAQRREARFDVDLGSGDVFVASTFALSDGLDTILTLRDSTGAILAQSDDRGDGTLNSQIIYEAAAAGRYTVVVGTYDGKGVGDYILSLALDPNAEAPFNFAAIEGAPLAQYDGELGDAQPSRSYSVNLAAGQTLFARSDVLSGNLDPVLRLTGPDGHPVALNDDRGDGSLNSALAYTAPADGAYTLEISRYRQSGTGGAYRIVLLSTDRSLVTTLQALVENQVTLSGPERIIETADFRLHYTLEGQDASTSEYAQATAEALQAALEEQVERLGWAAPIRGEDGRIRAYVAHADGSMGYVKAVQMVFDNPSTPGVRETAAARGVLVIDNDFRGTGKSASPESLMRATVAHELNHILQHGYDSQEGLSWLYESTASWMETATAGSDQDATGYVETDFAAPERCWTTSAEGHNYAQWTLLQSLADSHGDRIVVGIWENSVRYDGFETMSRTLAGVGTTIPDAIQRWRAQNFARDYDLAPLFGRSVRLHGSIARDGAWTPNGRVEQLGAHYVAVNLRGARTYALQGDANLELVGLGRRNGAIEVIPLGRGGVFDASAFENAALMVFHRALPDAPGVCRGVSYSIQVSGARGSMARARYQFSAEHFAPPS